MSVDGGEWQTGRGALYTQKKDRDRETGGIGLDSIIPMEVSGEAGVQEEGLETQVCF